MEQFVVRVDRKTRILRGFKRKSQGGEAVVSSGNATQVAPHWLAFHCCKKGGVTSELLLVITGVRRDILRSRSQESVVDGVVRPPRLQSPLVSGNCCLEGVSVSKALMNPDGSHIRVLGVSPFSCTFGHPEVAKVMVLPQVPYQCFWEEGTKFSEAFTASTKHRVLISVPGSFSEELFEFFALERVRAVDKILPEEEVTRVDNRRKSRKVQGNISSYLGCIYQKQQLFAEQVFKLASVQKPMKQRIRRWWKKPLDPSGAPDSTPPFGDFDSGSE